MPVTLYPDPLRFAGVIREKPILSKCIVCLHACVTACNDNDKHDSASDNIVTELMHESDASLASVPDLV